MVNGYVIPQTQFPYKTWERNETQKKFILLLFTPSRVRNLPNQDVIRDTTVDGLVPELAEQIRQHHQQFYA